MFGTGVTRIKHAYENARIKPKFMITENVISVILPVISEKYNVTADEEKVDGFINISRKVSVLVTVINLILATENLWLNNNIFSISR